MPEIIRREFETKELRIEGGGDGKPGVLVGHALVFNSMSETLWDWAEGEFQERILPGATQESIGRDDIRSLFNHDASLILGRNRAGTLRLKEDEVGLAIENDLPDTQVARDLAVSIKRGDITQMSFGFRVERDGDEWERSSGMVIRTLKKVRLFDVSPVTFPAYTQTDIAARAEERRASWKRWIDGHPEPARPIRQRARKLRLAMATGISLAGGRVDEKKEGNRS